MADLNHFRHLVQNLLETYGSVDFNNPDLETEIIFDIQRVGGASPEENRYQVVHVGWSNKRRVYGCILTQ